MITNPYSTWLEVDLGSINNNIKAMKAMTAVPVMAVINANGYGHGALARVCMDQCMNQLDSVPEAQVGDEVVLFGEQCGAVVSVADIAKRWGTINYEVVCGLADRFPRLYTD